MNLNRLAVGLVACLTASLSFSAQPQMTRSSAATNFPLSLKATMNQIDSSMPSNLTTLEVMGVGLSLEMFRQSQVWFEMKSHPRGSILPSDLTKFPTNATLKELATDKRSADAVEWGAGHFVEQWPIPTITTWASCSTPEIPSVVSHGKTNFEYFYDRVVNLRRPAGLHNHKFVPLGSILLNEPEQVLERAFQFFDQNPEVPALLLFAADGDVTRAMTGDMSREPYWEEGPRRVDSMTEAMVVLVLARRDRVDALRPFAPHPTGDRNAQFYVEHDRQLNAARAAARAAGKPEPQQLVFKPSRYVPQPWTEEQLAQFDSLATIAVVHRPVTVSYRKDKHGKPTADPAHKASLMHDKEQQAVFKTGLDAARQGIPGGKPARVFYDTGGPAAGRHVVPLSLAAHHSLPDFDLFKPDQGYDLHARLGNTGAASPFVQWALAAIAAHHEKNASLTVNLRRNDEATITAVTPSPDSSDPRKTNTLNFKLAQ